MDAETPISSNNAELLPPPWKITKALSPKTEKDPTARTTKVWDLRFPERPKLPGS